MTSFHLSVVRLVVAASAPGWCGSLVQAQSARVVLEEVAVLTDAGAAILARPGLVSVDPRGRFIIEDRSDKDVKVYDSMGRRVATIGRPGGGPGEFASLQTAQVYRDSIITYDFAQARLTVFGLSGKVARTANLLPPPWKVRVVDDSLFLYIGHPARGGKLLRLVRADGSEVSSFFETSDHFDTPQLRPHSVVFADARDGIVFAGFFGGDSLFAFDYAGRRLAAGPVDPVQPLVALRWLVRQNDGQLRRNDGTWVHDGARALINVVALSHSRVALHVAPYSARVGTDPLEGGTLLIASLARGHLVIDTRATVDAGPIGRDRAGELLLLKYAGAGRDAYVLKRLTAFATLKEGR